MTREDDKIMELLSAYIDDEVDETEKTRISSFLATSVEGRKALERIKHTKTLLMSAPPVKVPEDLLDALENQAIAAMERREEKRFWRWSNPWSWATPMAGVAAAFALTIGLRAPEAIPYSALLAEHAAFQSGAGLHQQVVAAAHLPAGAAVRESI